MNRKSFFKTLGAAILTAVIPNKLFSENKPESKDVTNESPFFQWVIINKNGKYQITPIHTRYSYSKDRDKIDKYISVIRIHNL